MSDRKHVDRRRETHGSRLHVLALLAAMLLAAPSWAYAYVMAMSLQEMTDRATLIVKGSVTDISRKDDEIQVTIRILQTIKGSASGPSIRIHYPHGLEDTPQFTIEEQALLFLTPVDGGTWQVVGGMQGKVTLGK